MSRGAGRRRRGRELALRVLFELEGTQRDAEEPLRYQATELGATEDVSAHAHRLVEGCLRDSAAVDAAIGEASLHWRLWDIGKVERALLRLGTWELISEPDVPVAVVINEAVELARTYAGDEARGFVNGVLGRVAIQHRGERV